MTIILFLLILLIAAIAYISISKPDIFKVTRTMTMRAPAAVIFPHIDNLRQWGAWSPWAKMDPGAQMTFEGPTHGVGAKVSWIGRKTGQGTQTITESRPNELIVFRLDFVKPMKATNTATFALDQQGEQTTVVWTMSGKNTLLGKLISVFMDCEKMVGGQFEQGLGDLKTIIEAEAKSQA